MMNKIQTRCQESSSMELEEEQEHDMVSYFLLQSHAKGEEIRLTSHARVRAPY